MRERGARLRRRVEHAVEERLALSRRLWRRSMQLRVVLSTVAMSTVVVLVLGLVLQTQIADRLLEGKEQAALVQADISRGNLERDLARVDPDRDGTQATLDEALDGLTSSGSGSDRDAGAFEAVLVAGTEAIGTPGATGSSGSDRKSVV